MKAESDQSSLEVPEVILKDFEDQTSRLPISLFKFCDHRGLNILLNGELKITPPREFNDPFEFSPGVWKNEPSAGELREHFLAQNGFPRLAYFDRVSQGSEARYTEWVDQVILKRPDLAPKHLCVLREAVRANLSRNIGIACFSGFSLDKMGSAEAVRHWAIYGGNHGGLAIEFNGRHELFKKWAKMKMCFRVTYESERPKCILEHFRDTSWRADLQRLRRWGAVKSKAWKHEREWRLITRLLDAPGLRLRRGTDGERILYFLPLWDSANPSDAGVSIVRRVILGCRATEQLKASVRATLNQPHLNGVQLCIARENDGEFRLDL